MLDLGGHTHSDVAQCLFCCLLFVNQILSQMGRAFLRVEMVQQDGYVLSFWPKYKMIFFIIRLPRFSKTYFCKLTF